MSNNIYTSTFLFYIIYETTCIVNQKTYIGCHATNKLDDGYIGSGKLLKAAIKKYGKSNFKRTVLFSYNNPVEMFNKERALVNEEFVNSTNSYNLVIGGSGGFKILDIDDWKNKLSIASVNRSNKQPMLGKHHSDETKQLISDNSKNKIPWNKGMPGTWIGKSHTTESKQKISQNRKGLTSGSKNPMYGKSAVAGRKWYNDGITTYYLFPTDPATATLVTGRLLKPNS